MWRHVVCLNVRISRIGYWKSLGLDLGNLSDCEILIGNLDNGFQNRKLAELSSFNSSSTCIGSNIRRLREKKGLTQERIAERLNVSFQAVSSWERDEYKPDLDNLVKIAKHM